MDRSRWDVNAPRVRGLVTPVPIDPVGLAGPTPKASRGPRWRRTTPGLFVPAEVGVDLVEQRIVEQAARLTTGAVTGWAALRLHGGGYFDGIAADGRTRLPVPLVANRDRLTPGNGNTVSRSRLDGREVVIRHGIRCATIERALYDEMRRTGQVDDGVVAMDMAAAAELTSNLRMKAYVADRPGDRGRWLVLEALAFADEGSRSPMETRLRLIWVRRAGWPRPLTNRAALDHRGGLIGVPDLLDERRGIGGEYDGGEHRAGPRRRRDVRREDCSGGPVSSSSRSSAATSTTNSW